MRDGFLVVYKLASCSYAPAVFLGFIFLGISDTAQLHGMCVFSTTCEGVTK